MENRAFIFDLDGVLVFTDKFHFRAWKEVADELGVYFDEKINNRLRGVSRMESLEIILERYEGPALSLEEKAAIAEKKNGIYREELEHMSPEDVDDDVRATLKKLKNMGKKLAVASSSKNAGFILDKVDLRDSFDAVADGNCISKSKPDPEVFLKAAEFLDLNPKDCVVVEDARAGIDAAKAGNMMAVGIGEAADYERTDRGIFSLKDLLYI